MKFVADIYYPSYTARCLEEWWQDCSPDFCNDAEHCLVKVAWKTAIMRRLCVIIILCISASESQTNKKDLGLAKQNTTEQKVWTLKLDVYFAKSLPAVVKKSPGADLRLKCEALMNITRVDKYTKLKETLDTPLKEYEHILHTLMKNVKFYWLKDDKSLAESARVKANTKIDYSNSTLGTYLRIKGVQESDKGNYTCVIKHNSEKRQTTKLEVLVADHEEQPTYASLFPDSVQPQTTTVGAPEDIKSTDVAIPKTTTKPKTLEPICQEYVGEVCASHLKGHFVYIPYTTTQETLEGKLLTAVQVTRYSNEISSICEGYALPSLCYSTFPICRDPMTTNDNFFREAKEVFQEERKVIFENVSMEDLPPHLKEDAKKNSSKADRFNLRFNSTLLRRVCKQDCVILENELCQTEYVIAKRHPQIGKQLTLEECHDLPDEDPDCLKIGIGGVMVSDDECHWENGNSYLGKVAVADNGLPCMEWSKQLHVKVSDYLELAGSHSYCRNPGGIKPQPWCVVERDGRTEKQLCDIPKCAHKIWIYIVVVFFLLTLTIISFILCLCHKNRSKNSTNISDMNLPTDKNIYGNSRLNSPIEMSDLISNPGSNQPHLQGSRPVRGNGALRVPQYTLSQIKFLEELGEGAFGKVYKGALKINGDTQYVAVKALKENASTKTQADFRREIDLISELRHDNIVCIVGVALKEEPLCMLFEFMARGDLHEFLMGRAPPSGKGLPAMRLLNIAYNIACGMHYLASHHYVHRDLAARNCLVSDDFVVKISDFGLSRDIYSSDYYRVQSKSLLPVRWMPPESILYGKFTTESDIWSYGVVLWEIYSYGLQPYYGYSNQEVIGMVRAGSLPAAPAACPAAARALMRQCWSAAPQARPRFDEIVNRLQSWIEQGGCPEVAPTEPPAPASECGSHRGGSTRDLRERVPLLPHTASNGSLATGSLKKFSVASTSKDDACSTCSEVPPPCPKKKGSSGSLIDTDRVSTRDTVVRIPNAQFGNEI